MDDIKKMLLATSGTAVIGAGAAGVGMLYKKLKNPKPLTTGEKFSNLVSIITNSGRKLVGIITTNGFKALGIITTNGIKFFKN